jgi:hypothetical protein
MILSSLFYATRNKIGTIKYIIGEQKFFVLERQNERERENVL